jgi:hypothetical protein
MSIIIIEYNLNDFSPGLFTMKISIEAVIKCDEDELRNGWAFEKATHFAAYDESTIKIICGNQELEVKCPKLIGRYSCWDSAFFRQQWIKKFGVKSLMY